MYLTLQLLLLLLGWVTFWSSLVAWARGVCGSSEGVTPFNATLQIHYLGISMVAVGAKANNIDALRTGSNIASTEGTGLLAAISMQLADINYSVSTQGNGGIGAGKSYLSTSTTTG